MNMRRYWRSVKGFSEKYVFLFTQEGEVEAGGMDLQHKFLSKKYRRRLWESLRRFYLGNYYCYFRACTQAVTQAPAISTAQLILKKLLRKMSMPYLGRTSFLHISGIKRVKLIDGVNALSRAHFISTLCVHIRLQVMTCVNALSRAHFISTKKEVHILKTAQRCQCPISGALHFYGVDCLDRYPYRMCQCPISGALHFYLISDKNETQKIMGVNALSRAHFISTIKISIF